MVDLGLVLPAPPFAGLISFPDTGVVQHLSQR